MVHDYAWCRWEWVGGLAKSVSGHLTAYCMRFTARVCCGVGDEHYLSVEILEAEGSTKEAEV